MSIYLLFCPTLNQPHSLFTEQTSTKTTATATATMMMGRKASKDPLRVELQKSLKCWCSSDATSDQGSLIKINDTLYSAHYVIINLNHLEWICSSVVHISSPLSEPNLALAHTLVAPVFHPGSTCITFVRASVPSLQLRSTSLSI